MSIKKPFPTLVQVSRELKGPYDLESEEQFVGYLVDEKGNDQETPEVGHPICLAGDQSRGPWIFKTASVEHIEVYQGCWIVITESGSTYTIETERSLQ